MCALRKGSVRPQGRADCLDGRIPPVCRDANEHNDSIERVPPKIVHRPPAGVLRFRTGRDQDSSLHAVASLRVPNVPACGVLGQPLRGEPFEGEPICSARSARNIGVGCQLQQNRSRIGGAFAMKWTQRIRNVVDRTADGQRLEHEQTDHRGVFSAFIAHESKATHSRGDDRLPLAQSAHTGQSARVSEPTNYWATAYAEPPLDRLERLTGDTVFDWINREMSSAGSKIDWPQLTESHRHWLASSPEELSAVLDEFLAALPALDQVDHAGDSLSPFEVRIKGDDMATVIAALLSIPEHHYFVAADRSWIAVFTMEGDVDLALVSAQD